MSMIGNYRRVTMQELAALRVNPASVIAFLYPADNAPFPAGRHLDIDKAWHAIHFLLNGDAWDGDRPLMDAVLGGTALGEEDVGYGPARYLEPDEVREVAQALDDLPEFELLERFDAAALNDADIYTPPWSDADREYVGDNYSAMAEFFRKAAEAGDAMLLYLN
ncbi:MAG: YfbM family protein [Gemmataceae bacterium]